MKNIIAMFVVALLSAGMSQAVYSADAKQKAPSCKEEAKTAGLTDKKEIKEFVKQCKKDRKAAKDK